MRLELSHDDHTTVLDDGELLFGRTGDLVVGGQNQFVHRTMGRFFFQHGCWWVENRAQNLPITVRSSEGTVAELAAHRPHAEPAVTALPGPMFMVRFEAGGTPYEIHGSIDRAEQTSIADARPAGGEETLHVIRLTDEEHELLLELARPLLLDPQAGPDALPTNKAVARALGWPDTKLNRKLDYLCVRLTKLGFQGLKGDLGGEAKLRRWRLVQYAVSHGLVTSAHLGEPWPADLGSGPGGAAT